MNAGELREKISATKAENRKVIRDADAALDDANQAAAVEQLTLKLESAEAELQRNKAANPTSAPASAPETVSNAPVSPDVSITTRPVAPKGLKSNDSSKDS